MYVSNYAGLSKNTRKSKQRDTTWMCRKMRCINTSQSKKMRRLRTMGMIPSLMKINSMDTRRLETFVTSTVALWIWAISDMGTEFSYKSWISDQIGNFRLD